MKTKFKTLKDCIKDTTVKDLAFPIVFNTRDWEGSEGIIVAGGLSKREYFAGLAMQGFCTNDPNIGVMMCERKNIAELAVMRADALIAELNKVKS